MSHPEEMAVDHAFNSIARVENALFNAEQQNEQVNTVQQGKEQLDLMKRQLNKVQEIVEEH